MGGNHSHQPEPEWPRAAIQWIETGIGEAQRQAEEAARCVREAVERPAREAEEQRKREYEAREAQERQRQAEEAARYAREAAERAAREAEEQRQREYEAQLAAERAAQAAREEAERMRRQMEERERAERRAREEAEARAREERARAERIAREMEEERRRQEAERLAAIAAREEEARRLRAIEEETRRARRAQEEEERKAREAAEAARKAQAEREEAERQLKKGIQPVVMPTAQEIRLAKAKVQYDDAIFHFAVAGIAGSGKSSLINALCGMSNSDPNAAATRYVDTAHSEQFAWYDIPGSGTLTIPDWQYFNSQGLYVFDCILVLFNNRFTMTDQAILANSRRFQIPTFIVRSKSDQHIFNLMKDMGYDPDEEDADNREQFYRVAREQYVSETRQSVKDNLAEANLPDQRVCTFKLGISACFYPVHAFQLVPLRFTGTVAPSIAIVVQVHGRFC
ncbi:hypothetical protein F5141DRAFT_1067217 [Pisolithus sp. B1]|nr:hypothetical protein F5141DRAFT_1067217 [Pisolithus sp. B1]